MEALKIRISDTHMDTVVFFDEANTTDSIGLIKEIMCDHRINGKAIHEDLKFIAACNPYRKLVHFALKHRYYYSIFVGIRMS